MDHPKLVVKVNTSFAKGEELFAFLKKYAQHSNDSFAFWDEFAFTVANLPETDALLVFNQPSENIHIQCDPGKLLAFMMEPGIPRKHPWMFAGLDQYSKVFSPIANTPNTVASHGYLGWYLHNDWSFLSQIPVPSKTKLISCIASDLKQLKGHRLRIHFINQLRIQMPQIDFFGRGSRFLPDKLDGLLPYRYSIAIENTSAPDYFTEKINDCFLAYTVPVYYGATNIGKYFPAKSFIQIDIRKPVEAIKKINELLTNDNWTERLPALLEARALVLNKYQPLAGAAAILRDIKTAETKQSIFLQPLPLTGFAKIIAFFKRLTGKDDSR
jgi:hypothetical protein